MSFKTLKVEQLRFVAEAFTVDVDLKATKPVLLAAIEEDENTNWEDAELALKNEGLLDEETEEAVEEVKVKEATKKEEANPKDTLLKMYRANHSYEIYGYTFTKAHPFALVTAADAEAITEGDPDGFRYATPKEASEFYG